MYTLVHPDYFIAAQRQLQQQEEQRKAVEHLAKTKHESVMRAYRELLLQNDKAPTGREGVEL